MAIPLLKTKLYIPPVRPELVPRPRLIERLNEGIRSGRKLTLVSSPAGYGKTTLLSEWIASLDPRTRIAWVSLDEGDNDLARFLSYLIAALQTIEEGIGEGALGALQSMQMLQIGSADAEPGQPWRGWIEPILVGLINEISAALLDDDESPLHILVLDDYHLVTAQPIHNVLVFLLDHLPTNMHLVIATRADPPLLIARLRGRGQLTELRLADLRFTPEEAAMFLNRFTGLSLSPDEIHALCSRTEGWVAGLQMAAVSMRDQEDVASFVHAFAGSDRYILDYLAEEVLRRQPDTVQLFLLQTSILDRLSAPLCDAVLDKESDARRGPQSASLPTDGERLRPSFLRSPSYSQAILEYLERANLFVVPLNAQREWYRYHRLFADLLQKWLGQLHPDLISTLHSRASEWHEQNGLVAEAIEHALKGQAFERAARLTEQVAEATLMRSEMATLLRWVERLPEELVQARPSLCLCYAWALVISGRPWDAVESYLREVDDGLAAEQVAPMRAFLAVLQGRMSSAVEWSRRALEQLPEDHLFLRSFVTWLLAVSQLEGGPLEDYIQNLDQVIRMSQQVGNVMVAAGALRQLARIHARQGQLHKAKRIYERAIESATDEQGQVLPVAGRVMMGLGDLLREWNDLEAAERCLVEGIELTERWRGIASLPGYMTLAFVRQAQGNEQGARDAMRRARQLAIEFDVTDWDDVLVEAFQARLEIEQGNVAAAARWAEQYTPGVNDRLLELEEVDQVVYQHLHEYIDLVRTDVLIAQNRPAEALELLESLLPIIDPQARKDMVLEIQILKSLAFQAQGDVTQAMGALGRALSLAEPGGYVRIFVDKGEPMARLLSQFRDLSRKTQQKEREGTAYAGKLLAAFGGGVEDTLEAGTLAPVRGGEEARQSSRPLAALLQGETLSERELEVLRLLPSRLSTPEIARELYVSVHTVRSHVKSIYAKLGVHRRADAVQRARELGLL
jgi:LuxR family maltose regulon positive regulatory protein